MRLLLANPNTTAAVTERIAAAARGMAAPGTEIVAVTAAFGAEVIATRTDMAVAEHASVEMLAAHAGGCDAAIVGASLDSGLRAARQMLPVPVLGITEAALHTACLLGGRFGILALSPRALVITREMIEAYGLISRLGGMRALATTPQGLLADPDALVAPLAAAAMQLVEQELVETVVLIGAVMAGMDTLVQPGVPVPVLEGVRCAVPLAEGLARLAPPKPREGTYAPPSPLPAREGPGVGRSSTRAFPAARPNPPPAPP